MKKTLLNCVAGGLLAVCSAGSASADLLSVDIVKPYTLYNSTGVTTYNHATDRFSVTASLLATQFADGVVLLPFATSTIQMTFKVNGAGRVYSGVNGADLVMTGDVDVDGDTIPEYTGTLLTGEIIDFGFQEAGATDLFDMKFRVTGGSMAGVYAKTIGVTLTVENSTFTGSFCQDFMGGAKGTVGNMDGDKCPRTPNYWKQCWQNWPRQSLTVGGVDYCGSQLFNILCDRLPNGCRSWNDPTVDLARYVIAAKFSFLDGAIVDGDVVEALALADAFLAAHPIGSELTEDEADLAAALQETLQAYVTSTDNCGPRHNCHNPCGNNNNGCHRYRNHCGWGGGSHGNCGGGGGGHNGGGSHGGGGCR